MPIIRHDPALQDNSVQTQNAVRFAELLQGPAEGHALFHPQPVGSIADCGYIANGTFFKLFNVCDPPAGIGIFHFEEDEILREERDNSENRLQSSQTRSVKFKASATVTASPNLPADTHPVEIIPEITRSSDDFAFLAFAGAVCEVDIMNAMAGQRLVAWVAENGDSICQFCSMSTLQIIHTTVKSAGWLL